MKSHNYDAFISFAEPDRPLALLLNKLLSALGFDCFYAPKNVPARAPERWQEFIVEAGLKRSTCFVPIYTPNSLKREWVLFEAGAAAAMKLRFLATRIEAIDPKEIMTLPFGHRLNCYGLHEKGSLMDLAQNIYCEKLKKAGKREYEEELKIFRSKVELVFSRKKPLVKELLGAARRRWAFIAGNLPSGSEEKTKLRKFVGELTRELLTSGFNISACPQVKNVGLVALKVAHSFMEKGNACTRIGCKVDYEFGGIYPIDHVLRYSKIGTKEVRDRWRQHLLEFRESYLEGKEWVVLIGGNEGTREEFEAIQRINGRSGSKIKTCFVTCFGGVAKSAFARLGTSRSERLYFDGIERLSSKANPHEMAMHVAKLMSGE